MNEFVIIVVLVNLLNAMPIIYNRNPKSSLEWLGFISGIAGFVVIPIAFIFSIDLRIAGTANPKTPPQFVISALILLTNLYFTCDGTAKLIKKHWK